MQEKIKNGMDGATEACETPTVKTEAGVWRRRIYRCAIAALHMGGGWLLGQAQLLFGTYPLGLAFLCAAKRNTLPILAGLIWAAFWQGELPILYVVTYVAAAVVRIAASLLLETADEEKLAESLHQKMNEAARSNAEAEQAEPARGRLARIFAPLHVGNAADTWRQIRSAARTVFSESVRLRMASGAVCAFIVALYRILAGGFQYYDLFGAIFAVLVTPAAVMVFSVCMEERRMPPVLRRISRLFLFFSFVWAADGVFVAGFSLAIILAFFFALYTASLDGIGWGAAAGLACGTAYQPLYAPAFLLAALLYASLAKKRSEGAATLLGGGAALAWSVYVGGATVLFQMVPALLIAGTVHGILTRLSARTEEETDGETDEEAIRLRMRDGRYQDSSDRFRGISDAFSSLSEMFYNLSDRFRRPGTLDLRRICDSSFDAVCSDCPNKTICWGLEYSATLQCVNRLIAGLHTKGKVSRSLLSPSLQRRCDSADRILESINHECAKLTGELLRNNRTEIFAMDYESAASIINDALEEDDGEYRFDPEQEQRVAEYLADAGVGACGVTVYGRRRRQILVRGVDVEHAKVTVDTLRADLSEMCGLALCRPIFEVEGNVSTMLLQAQRRFSVEGAQSNVSADGGISGDTVNLFSGKKDYFYALISDGMGAGKEAALTSSLCSVFLEKMLRAGNRAGTSLRMLNNMMRSRASDSTRECSTTVDLLELDLLTGDASFMKSGAAPSFVVRKGVVHRLQAGTAPIGIICALDVETSSYRLKAGDTVVMISDGILQNDEECAWLDEYLSQVGGLSPEEIVYRICLHASEGKDHDDCSAIALRIGLAEE